MTSRVTGSLLILISVAGMLAVRPSLAENTTNAAWPKSVTADDAKRELEPAESTETFNLIISGQLYSVPRLYLMTIPRISGNNCLLHSRSFSIRFSVEDGSPLKPTIEGRALGTTAAKDPTGVVDGYIQINFSKSEQRRDPRVQYDNFRKYIITPEYVTHAIYNYTIHENKSESIIYFWI
ncbi:hypothetical protein AAIH70_25490 [Neorhizobium sp. BT27B]|uniref:hypothetical protein n=1 Tax=Neorhizobium sp. BT27B TaxID=3142625 RepID=UPI003D2AE9FC